MTLFAAAHPKYQTDPNYDQNASIDHPLRITSHETAGQNINSLEEENTTCKDQHYTEDESGRGYGERREPVMGPEFAQSWCDRNQTKHAANDRDGVKTGPLPIAPAQMQPQPEFVECQTRTDAINARSRDQVAARRANE